MSRNTGPNSTTKKELTFWTLIFVNPIDPIGYALSCHGTLYFGYAF